MSRITLQRDEVHGAWEMATAVPDARLRPYVRRYVGWFDNRTVPVCRRELPAHEVPVVISFGGPIRLYDAGGSRGWTDLGSFASGAYDSYVLVETTASAGVQIDFTLLGARLFLSHPLAGLRNRGVPLEDLFGAEAHTLAGRLHDAASWASRFALLDAEIGRRLLTAG